MIFARRRVAVSLSFALSSAVLVAACGGSTDTEPTPGGGGGGEGPDAVAPPVPPGSDGGGTTSDGAVPSSDSAAPPGDDDASEPPAPGTDGGTKPPPPGTDGGPGGFACAPHPAIPKIKYWGGPILHAPEIVTITYKSLDATIRSQIEQFSDTITQSGWWDTTMAGYCDNAGKCIGHGKGAGHVVLDDPASPVTYTETQTEGNPRTIVDFIQAQVDSGAFPSPTDEMLYAIYFSPKVTVSLDGATSCGGSFGGYHFAADITPKGGGTKVRVAYAIMPVCKTTSAASLIGVASHEYIEAATDAKSLGPDIRNADWGFYMEDPAWGILFSGQEVGDLCEGYPSYTEGGNRVARGWLHDLGACSAPCGPASPDDSFFGAAPSQQVIELAVGESATLDVTAFSQKAIADFQVSAVEPANIPGGTGSYGKNLQFTLTVNGAGTGAGPVTMNNGAKGKLTVKLVASPPEDQNYPTHTGERYNHAFAYLAAKLDSKHQYRWPFTVREKKK